jgi:hypothetical protein
LCHSLYVAALRVYPKDRITADEAQARLRDSYTAALRAHVESHGAGAAAPQVIVDVGCSVGISTRWGAVQVESSRPVA